MTPIPRDTTLIRGAAEAKHTRTHTHTDTTRRGVTRMEGDEERELELFFTATCEDGDERKEVLQKKKKKGGRRLWHVRTTGSGVFSQRPRFQIITCTANCTQTFDILERN